MDHAEHLRRARAAFRDDIASPPALTLRGASAVDGYDEPQPFDAESDAPTDAYVERFTYWAMSYLDARSWRHYLPRLIEYTIAHPTDPAMVTEALVRSLRPPDRVPARLATLSAEQEAVIVELLEWIALGERAHDARDAATAALEEWWLPGATLRPRVRSRASAAPSAYREVGSGAYRLALPTTLAGGGVHEVPSERRAIESWRGTLCGDVLADVFVNVQPLAHQGWRDAETRIDRWLAPDSRQPIEITGAKRAIRLDGATYRYSPAEPERTTVVLAMAREQLVTLTVRAAERADVLAETDRIIRSFELGEPEAP